MEENRFLNNEQKNRPSNEDYIRGISSRGIREECNDIIEA